MQNLPSKLLIHGKPWKVYHRKSIPGGKKANSEIDTKKQVIYISKNVPTLEQKIEELIKWIYWATFPVGFVEMEVADALTERHAPELYRFLKENNCLTGEKWNCEIPKRLILRGEEIKVTHRKVMSGKDTLGLYEDAEPPYIFVSNRIHSKDTKRRVLLHEIYHATFPCGMINYDDKLEENITSRHSKELYRFMRDNGFTTEK